MTSEQVSALPTVKIPCAPGSEPRLTITLSKPAFGYSHNGHSTTYQEYQLQPANVPADSLGALYGIHRVQLTFSPLERSIRIADSTRPDECATITLDADTCFLVEEKTLESPDEGVEPRSRHRHQDRVIILAIRRHASMKWDYQQPLIRRTLPSCYSLAQIPAFDLAQIRLIKIHISRFDMIDGWDDEKVNFTLTSIGGEQNDGGADIDLKALSNIGWDMGVFSVLFPVSRKKSERRCELDKSSQEVLRLRLRGGLGADLAMSAGESFRRDPEKDEDERHVQALAMWEKVRGTCSGEGTAVAAEMAGEPHRGKRIEGECDAEGGEESDGDGLYGSGDRWRAA